MVGKPFRPFVGNGEGDVRQADAEDLQIDMARRRGSRRNASTDGEQISVATSMLISGQTLAERSNRGKRWAVPETHELIHVPDWAPESLILTIDSGAPENVVAYDAIGPEPMWIALHRSHWGGQPAEESMMCSSAQRKFTCACSRCSEMCNSCWSVPPGFAMLSTGCCSPVRADTPRTQRSGRRRPPAAATTSTGWQSRQWAR